MAIIIIPLATVLLLGSGLWIALSLISIGLVTMFMLVDAPVDLVIATTTWSSLSGWTLTALPVFIWMGEILFRTRLTEDLFTGLAPWVSPLPGRLIHTNVVACGIFAAVSGSSAATAATVGRITLTELKRRGYDDGICVGSLAASGTLGLLIPPSIIMIVYGVSANVSIARLFLAGVLPGIMVMGFFMTYIMGWAIFHKDLMPPADPPVPLREKLRRSALLIPTVLLIMAVIGSIYSGFATATEAATLGVLGSFGIAAASGSLTWQNFKDSLTAATRTSCMIAFIIFAAAFLAVAMGYAGIPHAMAAWITTLHLSPYALIFSLTILYLFLGCFLEGISMIVLTIAVVIPMVQAAGIDLVWFGVFVVIVVEIAQLTPPVGFNLFVAQALTGHTVGFVAKSILPFFFLLCVAIGVLTIYPAVVTWLPQTMFTR